MVNYHPFKMGGFMPSSWLELWQGLVYTAHSPEDFASELSSLKQFIALNLKAHSNNLDLEIFKPQFLHPLKWVVSLRWLL